MAGWKVLLTIVNSFGERSYYRQNHIVSKIRVIFLTIFINAISFGVGLLFSYSYLYQDVGKLNVDYFKLKVAFILIAGYIVLSVFFRTVFMIVEISFSRFSSTDLEKFDN
jgi:hypothetical protein